MSKYFIDSFEHLKASEAPTSQRNLSETIQVPYRDSKTGAEYLVQERRPNGPQGDFRQHRERGALPTSFGSRPDELEVIIPETMVSEADIERKVREREQADVRRSMAMRPTTEPAESKDWIDHGEYTEDLSGRIRDKPKNVVGLFGTEETRAEHMPLVPEEKFIRPSKASLGNTQTLKSHFSSVRSVDPIEKRFGSDEKLQTLLCNAFRGLQSLQNQKGLNSDKSDRVLGPEVKVLANSIMDAGLLSPWTAPKAPGTSDRPHKPDDVAHAVGTRALQSLIKGPLAHDIQDLPKADRDDMSKALGRTILNALAAGPTQKGLQSDIEDRPQVAELKKSIAMTISPAILAGLVNTEHLSDRRPKDLSAVQRLSGPAQKDLGSVPNRHTVSVSTKPEILIENQEKPVFKSNLAKKKNPFFDDAEARAGDRSEARNELNKTFERSSQRSELEARIERSALGSYSQRSEIGKTRH